MIDTKIIDNKQEGERDRLLKVFEKVYLEKHIEYKNWLKKKYRASDGDIEEAINNAAVRIIETINRGKKIESMNSYFGKTIERSLLNIYTWNNASKRDSRLSDSFEVDKHIRVDLESDLENSFSNSKRLEEVNKIIEENFDDNTRKILIMKMNGWKNEEISRDLGIKLSTVKTIYRRAQSKILKQMKDY